MNRFGRTDERLELNWITIRNSGITRWEITIGRIWQKASSENPGFGVKVFVFSPSEVRLIRMVRMSAGRQIRPGIGNSGITRREKTIGRIWRKASSGNPGFGERVFVFSPSEVRQIRKVWMSARWKKWQTIGNSGITRREKTIGRI